MSLGVASLLVLLPAGSRAQSGVGCNTRRPPAIGAAIGRSAPYFEPSGSVATASAGGLHLAGRVELPVAGGWRVRVEGATTDWRLEHRTFSADLSETVATDTVARVDVRHLGALLGRQTGRAPLCAYVLAGGGFYALGYEGVRVSKPGATLAAGLELPGGQRGAIQIEAQLHLVEAGGRPPIGSTTVVDARLAVAWVYRLGQ